MGGAVLGIDLGTSAVKAVLVDPTGLVHSASAAVPFHAAHPGWAEQNVADWWQATVQAVRALQDGTGRDALRQVQAIGLSGQMHGTVLLDGSGQALRPAIIWADSRSTSEAEALDARFAARGLSRPLGGRVAPGFMAATLAWLRHHEPITWTALAWSVLPKDALRLRMTGGSPLTDASDASSTLLFDQEQRAWSTAALEEVGLSIDRLPAVVASSEVVGSVLAPVAHELGLPPGVPVIAGGADQAMALVGAGALGDGDLLVSISSGGQLVAPLVCPVGDAGGRVQTFCHVLPGQVIGQAATLAAGLSLQWLRRQVLGDPDEFRFGQLMTAAAALPPGAEGLLFGPHLMGERPHPHPGGMLVGLGLRHRQAHLLRAVLEGVAFSLRAALDTLVAGTGAPKRLVAAGGGMRWPLWRQIVADVFGHPLLPVRSADQSALGAALLAGCAVAVFPNLAAAIGRLVQYDAVVRPTTAASTQYARLFSRYQRLDPLFRRAGEAESRPMATE